MRQAIEPGTRSSPHATLGVQAAAGGAGVATLCFTLVLALVVAGGWWWVWQTRQRYRAPLERAQALLAQDRLDEAIESFELALRTRPGDPGALRGLAACYLARGKLGAAAASADRAIAGDTSPASQVLAAEIALVAAGPWDPLAEGPKALADTERFYLDKAIGHAQAALAISPDSGPAHRVMGIATARRSPGSESALTHILRAAELEPDVRATRIAAGDILLAAGKRHEALAHYRHVAEQLDPMGDLSAEERRDLLRSLSAAAKVCTGLRLGDQAVSFWQRFLAAGGDKAKGHVGLVMANYIRGDYSQAIEESTRALRYTSAVNPSWDLHYYRGLAFVKLKRLDSAAQEFGIAITVRDDPAAEHVLGTVLLQEKDRVGARQAFLKALALDPRHSAARQELVKLLEGEGDVARALEELRRGVTLAPLEREPREALAAFCRRHGLDAEGEEALKALHDLKPPSARAAADLAMLYLERGAAERALPLAHEALRLEPASPEFTCLAGRAEAALGHLREAVGHFEEALRLDPNYVGAYLDWAATLEAAGERADAEETYSRARKALPGSVPVRCAYARSCIKAGRAEEGVEELTRLVERDRRDMAPRVILVDYFLSQGSKEAALDQARDVADALPESPDALGLLGRVYRARGEWDKLLVILGQMARLPGGEALLPQQLAALMHEQLCEAAIRLAAGGGERPPQRGVRLDLILGAIHFLGERQAKGIEIAGAAASANPRDCEAGFLQSLMQLGMGQPALSAPACREFALPDIALSAWTDLVRRRDQKSEKIREIVRLFLQAYVFEEVGWTDTAAEHLERILDIEPDCLIACCLAPVMWERAGNRRRAIAVCQRAVARTKGFAHGQLLLGDLLLLDGQIEVARAAYAACSEKEGPPFEAGTKLALLAMARGDSARAIQGWRAILATQPRHMPGSNDLAWLLSTQPEPELAGAAEAAQDALDTAAEDPAVLDTVGWVRYLRGEMPGAIDALERAVRAAPYRPFASLHLGLAYARKGRAADARQAFARAIELSSGGLLADIARQALQALTLDEAAQGERAR